MLNQLHNSSAFGTRDQLKRIEEPGSVCITVGGRGNDEDLIEHSSHHIDPGRDVAGGAIRLEFQAVVSTECNRFFAHQSCLCAVDCPILGALQDRGWIGLSHLGSVVGYANV